MKKEYILYFDSGTSNTRAYLLDREFRICDSAKRAVGSKDSAIAGTNRVLIEGMKALYDQVLAANSLTDGDVEAIYASGMVTSPYGLKEVPHLVLPMTVRDFADSLYPFHEDTCFHRDIFLVPGLKTLSDDFSHAMRIFEQGTPQQRLSYGESVIMGGVRQSLEYYCEHFWKECRTVALVSDEFMYRLFSMILEGSRYIDRIIWMPISDGKSYGVSGLKKIVSLKGERHE